MKRKGLNEVASKRKALGSKEVTRQFSQEGILKELRASRFVCVGNKRGCGDGIFVT
jgi:hypothetical protein